MEDGQTQTCRVCKEVKEIDAFSRSSNYATGRLTICKECRNQARRKKPPRPPIPEGMKFCTKCEVIQPLDNFSPLQPNNRGYSTKDGRRSWCKACCASRVRSYYQENSAERRAYTQQYRRNNHEVVLERTRSWRRRNFEHRQSYDQAYAAAHPDQRRENMRRWRKANGAWLRARMYARMEQQRSGGHFTASEWKALCDWFGNVCLRCGSPEKISVDHVVPLSKGGMNDISNIQPLCLFCNHSKNNRNSIDYRDPDRLAAFLAWLQGDER